MEAETPAPTLIPPEPAVPPPEALPDTPPAGGSAAEPPGSPGAAEHTGPAAGGSPPSMDAIVAAVLAAIEAKAPKAPEPKVPEKPDAQTAQDPLQALQARLDAMEAEQKRATERAQADERVRILMDPNGLALPEYFARSADVPKVDPRTDTGKAALEKYAETIRPHLAKAPEGFTPPAQPADGPPSLFDEAAWQRRAAENIARIQGQVH